MNETLLTTLESPRIAEGEALLVAGLDGPMTEQDNGVIAERWKRFMTSMSDVPGRKGTLTYGVCHDNAAGNMNYLCAVEVSDFSRVPNDLTTLRIPAQRYAVFTHRDHVSTVRQAWDAIFARGLPDAELEPVDAPQFERYDERFDPKTGNGGFEIWIPVKIRA